MRDSEPLTKEEADKLIKKWKREAEKEAKILRESLYIGVTVPAQQFSHKRE
jgi:hypothetical protein